ncbi:SIMPL domain-containing protein [Gordonia sp. PKS22-38]|uniref:SIMPL domain-containing protein n=1 Tax=Gordonia prachuapensis TaxID=3115651 RepID=A0ABU7MVE0_9ACTN|nr:SIMPL domain-containing protein [Gordonia sp. PKS22-38]
MPQLEIVVRGVARRKFPPEFAVLDLAVNRNGPSRDAVYQSAIEVHAALVAALDELVESGAIGEWTSDTVRVFGRRPYDGEGRRLDVEYATQIGLRARFGDFEALSRFVDRWSTVEGVRIGGVRWILSEGSRRDREHELRREAVDDAVFKAQAYADAVGRGAVTPIRLADPDMRTDARPAMLRAAPPGGPDSAPSLELRPADIEIAVEVDALFVADQ